MCVLSTTLARDRWTIALLNIQKGSKHDYTQRHVYAHEGSP